MTEISGRTGGAELARMGDTAVTPAARQPGPVPAEIGMPSPKASPAELEAHIEATRAQLAATLDQITERVSPRNVARRSADRGKAFFVDDEGAVRADRVAIVGGSAATVVALVVWRRRRLR